MANTKSNTDTGFTSLAETMPGVLKEIRRRAELRPRLEAEWGRPLTDREFLAEADKSGVQL